MNFSPLHVDIFSRNTLPYLHFHRIFKLKFEKFCKCLLKCKYKETKRISLFTGISTHWKPRSKTEFKLAGPIFLAAVIGNYVLKRILLRIVRRILLL
jgi:hypothetical protein